MARTEPSVKFIPEDQYLKAPLEAIGEDPIIIINNDVGRER
jgi:hypothetical protein